eukprot:96466-Prorocentrum_minimum.AAC.2
MNARFTWQWTGVSRSGGSGGAPPPPAIGPCATAPAVAPPALRPHQVRQAGMSFYRSETRFANTLGGKPARVFCTIIRRTTPRLDVVTQVLRVSTKEPPQRVRILHYVRLLEALADAVHNQYEVRDWRLRGPLLLRFRAPLRLLHPSPPFRALPPLQKRNGREPGVEAAPQPHPARRSP